MVETLKRVTKRVTKLQRIYEDDEGMEHPKEFKTIEDLGVYQTARAFRKAMYGVSRQLPDFEKYELASQMRRAAVSLTNNIAEGHGRYHYHDQIKFILHSRGSLEELIDDLNVCQDEHYLSPQEVTDHKQEAWRVLSLINGYLRYLRERKFGENLALHESPPTYHTLGTEPDPFIDGDM